MWKGICNTKARQETARKAKPLLTDDLRALIDGLEQTASGARDAALLALGWAAAEASSLASTGRNSAPAVVSSTSTSAALSLP